MFDAFTPVSLVLKASLPWLVITLLLYQPDVEERDLSGVSDNAVYWHFLTGAWIPLYVMVFLTPYFM